MILKQLLSISFSLYHKVLHHSVVNKQLDGLINFRAKYAQMDEFAPDDL